MNRSSQPTVDFDQCLDELGLEESDRRASGSDDSATAVFWEYQGESGRQVNDAGQEALRALRAPIDFPPLDMTVVDGDKVALAVDPNLPQLVDVVIGVVKALAMTEAGQVDVVLGDEATDATFQSLKQALTESIPKASESDEYVNVYRHDCTDRESLRDSGADADALPWYINRQLVDADVVLPIVTKRPMQSDQLLDITGIYPAFADSATRNRFRVARGAADDQQKDPPETQIPWLIGVQLMVMVAANHAGRVRQIVAGTPHSLTSQLADVGQQSDDFPPPAMLVIASTDGDMQQQTWANAARAAMAANRYVQPGGTILVWTEIDVEPASSICRILEANDESQWWEESTSISVDEPEALPTWDESIGVGMTLARVAAENRLVIRTRLGRDKIEPLGLGSLESIDELKRLLESCETCGVLRGAQFVADAVAATHRLGRQS